MRQEQRAIRLSVRAREHAISAPTAEIRDASIVGELDANPQQGVRKICLLEGVLLIEDAVSLGSR